MLPSCTPSQSEFVLLAHSGFGLYQHGYGGNSPAEVCRNFAVSNGGYMTNSQDHMCAVSISSVNFPVARACYPNNSSPFVMSASDGALLGMAIISVWVAGATVRWLVQVVRGSGERSD